MKLNQYTWNPEKDLIAEGAFAEVFKALDTNTQGRIVALKVYKEAVAKGSSGTSNQKKYSLEAEFQKIDGLSHTNIISYYGQSYIQHRDALGRSSSYPVIIMEYAVHGTLFDYMSTKPEADVVEKLIRDIIQGVGYLHSEGIVHRDLKPGNILVTANRRGEPIAKITDFGISKDLIREDNAEHSTTEGVGTPFYMAPEQFFKRKYGLDGCITERTDLWGIGVIVYKMLTGKLPFETSSNDYELIREAILESVPDMTIVPQKYQGLIAHCLQKKAVDRPASALSLLSSDGFIGMGTETLSESVEKPSKAPDITMTEQVPVWENEDSSLEVEKTITRVSPVTSRVDPGAGGYKTAKSKRVLVAVLVSALIVFGGYWTWAYMSEDKRTASVANTVPVEQKKSDDNTSNTLTVDDPEPEVPKTSAEVPKKAQDQTATNKPKVSPPRTVPNTAIQKGYAFNNDLDYWSSTAVPINSANSFYLIKRDKKVLAMSMVSGKSIQSFDIGFEIGGLAANHDPKAKIAVAIKSNRGIWIQIYDFQSGKKESTFKAAGVNYPMEMKYSPDGKLLALSGMSSTYIINVSQESVIKELPYGAGKSEFEFSHDSRLLAISSGSNIALYSVEENEMIKLLSQADLVRDMEFMPDNRQLAYISDSHLRIIDIADNSKKKEIRITTGAKEKLTGLAVKDDGRLIAMGGENMGGRFKLYNTAGKLLQTSPSRPGKIRHLSFSKEGAYLIAQYFGDDTRPLNVWKMKDINGWELPSIPSLSPLPTKKKSTKASVEPIAKSKANASEKEPEAILTEEEAFYKYFGEYISPKTQFSSFLTNGSIGEYGWAPTSTLLIDKIMRKEGKVDGKYELSKSTTKAEASRVPWLQNVILVKLTDKSWGNSDLALYYLFHKGEDLYRLEGEAPPIHALNNEANLNLNTKEAAINYLHFFCFFIRVEDGPFYIVESENDPFIPNKSSVRRTVKKHAKPVEYQKTVDGTYYFEAIIYHSDALFEVKMTVNKLGNVKMSDDVAIAVDLRGKMVSVIK